MHQIKEMLEKMGCNLVADEMKTTEGTRNDGFFVAMKDNIYFRVNYTVDSYGGEPVIVSVREVKLQQVTKVEYI